MKTWKFIIGLLVVAGLIGFGLTPVNAQINPGGTAVAPVCGTVTDNVGNPLGGMWINVWSDKLRQGNSGATNEKGEFCISVTGGAGYHIKIGGKTETDLVGGFFRDDDNASPWKGGITSDQNARTLIDVGSDGVKDIAIILQKGAVVSGVVLDDRGNPVPYAWVKAHSDIAGSGNGGTTDEKGNFKIPVTPGKGYKIAVSPELRLGLTGGIFKGAVSSDNRWEGTVVSDWEAGTPIDVGEAGIAGIKIKLKAGLKIFGKVVVSDITLPEGALRVEANSATGGSGNGTVSGDGSFSFAVPPGKGYVVSLWPSADTAIIGGFWKGKINSDGSIGPDGVLTPNREEATLLNVLDKDVEVNIVSRKGNTVSGRVTDESGNGVPRIWVKAFSKESKLLGSSAGTDEEGYYKLSVYPASDYIAVVYGDGRYQTQYYKEALTLEEATPIDASEGDAEDKNFVLKAGDCIAGTVTGLGLGEYAFVGVWSEKQRSGNGADMKGNGEPAEFKICGIASGDDYKIEVKAGNYQSGFLQADGSLGAYEQAELFASNAADVNITLKAGKCISGVINGVSEGDRLWINALSESSGSGNRTELVSKAEEVEFKMCGLAAAKDFRLGVNSGRYQSGFYGEGGKLVPWDMAKLLDTTADVPSISIVMDQGRKISGKVTGLALNEQAWIKAFSESTGQGAGADLIGTGEPVAYEIKGLGLAGDFRVSIHSKAYVGGFYCPDGEITADPEGAELVSTKDEDASGIDFTLSKGKTISGTISGLADGERAALNASSETGGWGGVEVIGTGKDIAYEIPGLGDAADFTVCFRPKEHAHACQEKVASGATDVNFTASAGSRISGKVEGAPALRWLWVDAFSESEGGHGISIQTDKNGSAVYEIKGLAAANDYIVVVHAGEKHLFYDNTLLWEEAAKVDISAGSKTGIDFIFANVTKKFYTLSGSVAGLPDDNRIVRIEAWDETSGVHGGTKRHGNGEFSMELPEGNYYVAFRAAGYADMLWSSSGLTSDRDAATAVSLSADKDIGEVSFTNASAGYLVSGKVTSADGKALAGVPVEISSGMSASKAFSTVTNREGVYNLKGIPADVYTIKVASRFGTYEAELNVSGDVKEIIHDITLGGASTGSLTGKVAFGGVAPAFGGVSVKLSTGGKLITAATGADGSYTFSGLIPGEYKVNAIGLDEDGNLLSGSPVTGKTVTVTAGETATLNIEG